MRVADQQAFQPGIALAKERVERNASETYQVILKPPAVKMQSNRLFIDEKQIGNLISFDLQSIQQISSGISAAWPTDSILEAERRLLQPLAEIPDFCQKLGLRMQHLCELARVEISNISLLRVAEVCAPRFSSLDIGLGVDVISSIRTLSDCGALCDPHRPVMIHAVPRLQSQRVARSGRCRGHLTDRALFPSPPEAQEEATGWLDDTLNDELLAQLSRFVLSEEIPIDGREGLSAILAWCQLNQNRLTSGKSLEFNLIVQAFIRSQLGLKAVPDGHQQLGSGLMVPRSTIPVSIPDLSPEVYTTKQLAKKVHATTDTLKRHARNASATGPLPQPLPIFPGWFVVSMSDPRGGKGCGWKFQEERKPEDM